jgi:hypothetical protein
MQSLTNRVPLSFQKMTGLSGGILGLNPKATEICYLPLPKEVAREI